VILLLLNNVEMQSTTYKELSLKSIEKAAQKTGIGLLKHQTRKIKRFNMLNLYKKCTQKVFWLSQNRV